MRFLAKKSILDVLTSLNEFHLKKLEEHFNEPVIIDKINYNLIENVNLTIDETKDLCSFTGYKEFCIYRNKNDISLTFWR